MLELSATRCTKCDQTQAIKWPRYHSWKPCSQISGSWPWN